VLQCYVRLCHSWGGKLPAFHWGRLGSITGEVMHDFWWTKWHWCMFSMSTSVSPVNSHSTNCSILCPMSPLLKNFWWLLRSLRHWEELHPLWTQEEIYIQPTIVYTPTVIFAEVYPYPNKFVVVYYSKIIIHIFSEVMLFVLNVCWLVCAYSHHLVKVLYILPRAKPYSGVLTQ
jgi:hypothetical protein